MARNFFRKLLPPGKSLRVEHFPNPSDIHTVPTPPKAIYPYMWFYRTEVTNTSGSQLKVVEFESYFWWQNHWISSNILRRPLTTEVFIRWYRVDDGTRDGWLQPGAKAICDINWHGGNAPRATKVKWVFYAIDTRGTLHQGEGEIVSVPYPTEKHKLN